MMQNKTALTKEIWPQMTPGRLTNTEIIHSIDLNKAVFPVDYSYDFMLPQAKLTAEVNHSLDFALLPRLKTDRAQRSRC